MAQVQYTFDDDGALTVTVDGHAFSAPLRESLMRWLLQPDVVGSLPVAVVDASLPPDMEPPSVSNDDAETFPSPFPAPAPKKKQRKAKAHASRSIRDRIVDALKEIAPCSQSAMWSHIGLAAGPGPQHRVALKTLVMDGVVSVSGPATNKTLELAARE